MHLQKKFLNTPFIMCLVCFAVASLLADTALEVSPRSRLVESTQHSYDFMPAYGHAAQMPGSPKYFVPGYGYRVPGYGFLAGYRETLSPYAHFYRFGQLDPQFYNAPQYRFSGNLPGGPWYFPGSATNARTVWPKW